MKKIIFALLAVAFVSSLCFAQQPTAPVSQAAPKQFEIKTFTGKVDSVLISDPTKGIPSQIVVVDNKGQELTFTVRITTTITDKDGAATTLDNIEKDNKVVIEYTTNQTGINRAKSVKVVE
jgi:outer membrane lipoprotein-sorting protein